MKNNRLSMFMDVEFTYPETKETERTSVYVPFPIFIEAIRKWADGKMVNLDGTDNAVWNFLVDLKCLDELEDNEELMDICRELYKGSEFEEEDFEFWKDEYEMMHNLGEYAEEE